ncbi:hypothetical protein C1646_759583 [Rhizophagus diaphanus]|nr:hypothetical protein C1646_759583 [Rhizophagus diaphanus] [Rhizophagus sp. MUCL 43196]
MEGREKCQVLGNLHKSNQDNNESSTQHASDKWSQQQQKGYKVGGEAEKENIPPETNELTVKKGDFRKNQDNIEEVVDLLTSEEKLNIAAHNIDGIASVPSIQKLHKLLEFGKENNIDIMAISETNIDYRQEYFINQDIKSKVYSIIFSEPKFLFVQREIWVWSIYAASNDQDIRKSLIEELKMAIERYNRSVHNTVVLHVLGLYDVCRVLYPDAELFTYEKWDKNKNRSAPISKSRIDQIWITHEPDVIPVEFLVHSLQMITNSHHSIISTILNISGFIRNNFRHCVPDQLQDPDLHQDKHIVNISKITNVQWKNFTEILDREIEAWDFQQLIEEVNYEIQLGDEKNTDGKEIKRRFNELWDNIISAISIVMNIELPIKLVKYPGSRNTRYKLSFADKTIRHTTKLGSLIRKIYKYEEIIIPTHSLFSDTWINNVKDVVKKRIKIDKNYLQTQCLSKIQDSIEKRCNIIHSDIPKWLLSTQDVVKEHIIIDRA